MLELIKNGEAFASKFHTECVRFKNQVKIAICRNDLPKPDSLYGKDREAFMDISIDTWEWVPHRVLEERWNELHPDDLVTINGDDCDDEGWYVERHGKKKTDHGQWFRGRTVERQIEEMRDEEDARVINNVQRLQQLKRKYTGLKIATWVYRRLKPTPEAVEEEEEEETSESIALSPEELAMVEEFRKRNRHRSGALLKKHRCAVTTLKRKREQRREDSLFEQNSKRFRD